MSKSAILRKALEYVRYLQQMNAKLQKENLALRMAAQKQSANGLVVSNLESPPVVEMTPPGSLENSSVEHSPPSSFGTGSPPAYAGSVKEIVFFLFFSLNILKNSFFFSRMTSSPSTAIWCPRET